MTEMVRAAFLKGFADLARTLGLDPLRLLDSVGIPRRALDEPDLRISAIAGRDLLERAGRAADDFGLRMSEFRTPSALGPVALISREQPTVREVLKSIARHQSLHCEVTTLTLEEHEDIAIVRLDLAYAHPGPMRQAMELTMGQLLQILRRPLGARWAPFSASMVHAPPLSLATHQRTFRCQLYFNQDFNGVTFNRADLDRLNPGADPDMARQIEQYIGGINGAAHATIRERVRRLALEKLSTGRCSAGDIADQLGLELRTLQRHLADAGTSFGEILQDVRVGLCARYIEESDRPLAEVADLLGFSALSAFSRWHRALHGRSPRERRATALRGTYSRHDSLGGQAHTAGAAVG